MKCYISLVLLLAFIGLSQAWFETCSYQYNVPTTGAPLVVTSPNFPSRYNSGSSCKFTLTAQPRYTIELSCKYNLDTPLLDCGSQRLYINREADPSLSFSEYYCGTSSVVRQSIGFEITLGYTSNTGGAGWFRCEARAVLTNQTNCQCGWSKTARIVGGQYAQPNENVAMAGLFDSTMTGAADGPIFCGSAIISEYYGLTAAHCFNTARNIANIGILVGDHDYSTGTDTPYPWVYKINQIIKHESYIPSSDNQNNDIALVKTTLPIKWKKTIGPACLPFIYIGYNTYFDGYALTVYGWGTTEFGGPVSKVLKKTNLAVVSSTSCSSFYPNQITTSKICTYTQGTDACQRDSGGNLFWTYSGRQYTIGVVSYGVNCAGKNPGVNTRVTAYLTWIQQKAPDAFFCNK